MRKFVCLVVLVTFMGSFCLPGFAEEPISFQQSSQKYMQAQEIYQLARAEAGEIRVASTDNTDYRKNDNDYSGLIVKTLIVTGVVLGLLFALSAAQSASYR